MKAANLELLHGYRMKELPLRRKQTHRQTGWLSLLFTPLHARGRMSDSRPSIDLEADSLGVSSCDHPVPENPVGFNHLTSDPNSCLNCPSPLASFSTYLMISFALKSFLYKNQSVAEHSTPPFAPGIIPSKLTFPVGGVSNNQLLKEKQSSQSLASSPWWIAAIHHINLNNLWVLESEQQHNEASVFCWTHEWLPVRQIRV